MELKLASEAITRNERPPRLHPLLLLISRLYPSALEGSDSNLKLSTFVPFISICSSSPELVTRQLSAKSMVALIPSANVVERIDQILNEINVRTTNRKKRIDLEILLLNFLSIVSEQSKIFELDAWPLTANFISTSFDNSKMQ